MQSIYAVYKAKGGNRLTKAGPVQKGNRFCITMLDPGNR